MMEPDVAQPEPCFAAGSVRQHRELDAAPEKLHERGRCMRIWLERRFSSAAIGYDAGRENSMIYLVEYAKNKIVENLLIFYSAFFIDRIDACFNIRAFQIEARVKHRVDRGFYRLPLHRHEIDERVIEIEYNGLNQGSNG